jgi:hypothetical protein
MHLSLRKAASLAAVLAGLAVAPATAAAFVDSPQVAVGQDGTATFAWRNGTADYSLIADRRWTFAGPAGNGEPVSDALQGALGLRIAVDSTGATTYVWTRYDGVDYRVQTRRRNADGTLSPVQTLSWAGGNAWDPQVGVDAKGNAVFTWRRMNAQNHAVAQGRTRTAAGALGSVFNLSAADADAFDPQVAVAPDGDAVFEWTRSAGNAKTVQGRARLADGSLRTVLDLSTTASNAAATDVEMDAGGNATFVWTSTVDGVSRVQSRRRTATGSLTPTVKLSAAGGDAANGRVGLDANGDAVFTWKRHNGTATVVQFRRRTPAGLTDVVNLSAPDTNADQPDVAVAPAGDAFFTYRRAVPGGAVAKARIRPAGGPLGPAFDLSTAGWSVDTPDVAADPQGNAMFVWQENALADDSTRIVARRRLAASGFAPAFKVAD